MAAAAAAAAAAAEESNGKNKRAMVAIDESECSRQALRWTLENLRASFASHPLVIFTVQPIANLAFVSATSLGYSCKFTGNPLFLLQAEMKYVCTNCFI